MRKYKGGADAFTSVPIGSFGSLPPIQAPSNVHDQIANASAGQNFQNNLLEGGKGRKNKRKNKKQHGGIGNVNICGGSVVNSPDGYSYTPPYGCMAVPVVPNGQDLAISSANISASGQAYAQYDPLFNE
jgi:hypothetical protein